ncbi:MAG TPA: hypothetical protein VNS57_12110 [Steroidobacteraceae bacterium]|nr:hypothetical protein [Steroidobacteraceae bacterium]
MLGRGPPAARPPSDQLKGEDALNDPSDATALEMATDAYTSEGGHVAPDDFQLAAVGVSFDGRQYRYETYRYDRPEDAVAYAELDRARRAASAPGPRS